MTTPEEQAPAAAQAAKEENLKNMLETLDKNIEHFSQAILQHQDHHQNHIVHIKGQLIDVPNKKVGANPLTVPKYSRQRARLIARKIKDGNGNRGEQMNFIPFCKIAISHLESLKKQLLKRFKD